MLYLFIIVEIKKKCILIFVNLNLQNKFKKEVFIVFSVKNENFNFWKKKYKIFYSNLNTEPICALLAHRQTCKSFGNS